MEKTFRPHCTLLIKINKIKIKNRHVSTETKWGNFTKRHEIVQISHTQSQTVTAHSKACFTIDRKGCNY